MFGFTAAPAAVIGQRPGMDAREANLSLSRGDCRRVPQSLPLWLGSMLLLAAAGSVAQREDAAAVVIFLVSGWFLLA
jgi:hypothetical protein